MLPLFFQPPYHGRAKREVKELEKEDKDGKQNTMVIMKLKEVLTPKDMDTLVLVQEKEEQIHMDPEAMVQDLRQDSVVVKEHHLHMIVFFLMDMERKSVLEKIQKYTKMMKAMHSLKQKEDHTLAPHQLNMVPTPMLKEVEELDQKLDTRPGEDTLISMMLLREIEEVTGLPIDTEEREKVVEREKAMLSLMEEDLLD